jgi:hypothetical protein
MAERQLPKLHTRVRFPSPAPRRRPQASANTTKTTLTPDKGDRLDPPAFVYVFLELKENGGKHSCFAYEVSGGEKLLSFGVWPDVSLKEAREKHQAARAVLATRRRPECLA